MQDSFWLAEMIGPIMTSSAVIVAIFIPVGLYLIRSVKGANILFQEKTFSDIFILPHFIWAVVAIGMAPILFWGFGEKTQVLTFVIWILGWFYFLNVTIEIIEWVLADEDEKKEKIKPFLRQKASEEAWEALWGMDLSPKEEEEFMEIFKKRIR